MVSDSVSDSCLFSGSPNSRDFAKKRRASWSARLKQWKLDARRKQWLSHLVAKKGQVSDEDNGGRQKYLGDNRTDREMDCPFAYLKIGWNDEEIDGTFSRNDSDLESSAASSPTSVLTSKDSGSRSGNSFCCSGQIVDEGAEVYDDAFDNWEGFADALSCFETEECSSNSSENKRGNPLLETKNSEQESPRAPPNTNQRNSSADKAVYKEKSPLQETSNPEQESPETPPKMTQTNCPPEPAPCPICFEEMDATDLSFLPCPCGFRLCLFCHKRIIDNDGRCPGCRKLYETGSVSAEVGFQQRGRETLRLSPSFRGLDRA